MDFSNEGFYWSLSSWKHMHTDAKKQWLFKFKKVEGSYQFLVTDMEVIYMEYVNAIDVSSRNTELNPRLETSISNVLDHIETSIIKSDENKCINSNLSSNELRLKLENKFVGDLPFKWKFYLQNSKNVDSCILKEFLISPLILTVQRLLFENCKLKEIISLKDKEIQDYKEKGAKVSRKFLETVEFQDANLLVELRESKEFAKSICSKPFNIVVDKMFNDAVSLAVQDNKSPVLHNLLKKSESSPKKVKDTDGSGISGRVLQTIRVPRSRKRGAVAQRKRVDPTTRGAKNIIEDSDTESDSNDIVNKSVPQRKGSSPVTNNNKRNSSKSPISIKRKRKNSHTPYMSDSDLTDFEDEKSNKSKHADPDAQPEPSPSQPNNKGLKKKNKTPVLKRGCKSFDSDSDSTDVERNDNSSNKSPAANVSKSNNLVSVPINKSRARRSNQSKGAKVKRPPVRRKAKKPPVKRGCNILDDSDSNEDGPAEDHKIGN